MDYVNWGQKHTREQRKQAALAGIGLLFGAVWSDAHTTSYLGPATQRLLAFAGQDAYDEVAAEVDLVSLPDEANPELVERAVQAMWKAFDPNESPNGRRLWREVARHARRSVA